MIEWNELTRYISGKSRKKFLVGFDRVLAKKLQSNGIKCWIKCEYNWFGAEKFNRLYWTGLYKCSSCNIKYKCCIESFPCNKSIELLVRWEGDCSHDKLTDSKSQKRIEGLTRLTFAQKIIADGCLNLTANEFLDAKNLDERIYFIFVKSCLR